MARKKIIVFLDKRREVKLRRNQRAHWQSVHPARLYASREARPVSFCNWLMEVRSGDLCTADRNNRERCGVEFLPPVKNGIEIFVALESILGRIANAIGKKSLQLESK